MLYFNIMIRNKRPIICSLIAGIIFLLAVVSVYPQEHIRKLDAVRAAMSKMGSSLPDLTRQAQPVDIRTMERVFEINNYSLVTIESYFKMIKIALSSSTGLNKDVLLVLNGWLKFISNYSEFDIKYIDEALSQTKNTAVIEILKAEKNNISSLREASLFGINENTATPNKP